MLIAIDGPSGSGKSTLAKRLSLKFGLRYMDTGAMYRAATVMALQKKIDLTNEKAMVSALKKANITFRNVTQRMKTGEPLTLDHKVYLNGKDVSRIIRTNEVSSGVSYVARQPGVRELLVALQRKKCGRNAVLEGRDITTVVLPNADVKIYLEAEESARISRRKKDYKAIGEQASKKALNKEIARRDKLDMTRKTSPLMLAEDAVHIDTTQMNADKVFVEVEKLVLAALKKNGGAV